jgi:hypothetical protein
MLAVFHYFICYGLLFGQKIHISAHFSWINPKRVSFAIPTFLFNFGNGIMSFLLKSKENGIRIANFRTF